MGFNSGKQSVLAGTPSWRAKTPSTHSWRRRESIDIDSGYDSTSIRSRSPPPSPFTRGRRSNSLSCDHCREYDFKYASYKIQERRVRGWLCEETGSPRPEYKLDTIDVVSLLRMAARVKGVAVPSSIKNSLVETIQGRKETLKGWHWDTRDHECTDCGRFWSKADEGHKHHIRELERMLGMLDGAFKPRLDPMALRSWR